MKHSTTSCITLAVLISAFLFAQTARGDTLLGGGASQYFQLWANPESESYVRFLFRLSTNIRFDKNIVMTLDLHKEKDLRESLLNTPKEELPDAAIMPLPLLAELHEQLPIAEVPDGIINKHIKSSHYNAFKINDKILAIPYHDGNHAVLLYNKKLVTEAPASFAELAQQTDNAAKIILPATTPYFVCNMINCFDGEAFSAARLKEGTEALNRLVTADVISNACAEHAPGSMTSYSCTVNEFYKGNVPYLVTYGFEVGEAFYHFGKDLGIANPPTLVASDKPKPVRMLTGIVFFNDAFSKRNLNSTKRVLNYLVGYQNQKSLFTQLNRVPINALSYQKITSRKLDILNQVNLDTMQSASIIGIDHPLMEEIIHASRTPGTSVKSDLWD